MKKKLAALLCGVMCAGAFTGCSTTELGYLNMGREMLDTMQSCKVTGTMQADVDFDALEGFMVDVAKATGANEVASVGELPDGKKSMKIAYDMNMDLQKLNYDMSFDVKYEGKEYDLGTVYYSLTDGVVLTTDTLLGAYQLAGAMDEKDSYVFSEAFARDFKSAVGQGKYVTLLSGEDMTGVDMSLLPENSFGDLYDAAFTFYEEVFKGFETGMIKKIDGGYECKADGQAVAQLLIQVLDFIGKNPEQVLNATENYLMAAMNSAGVSAEEKAQLQGAFAELKASQEDFVDAAGDMSAMLKGIVKEPSMAMLLNSFSYEAQTKKITDGYHSTASYTVAYKGKNVAKLTADSTTKKAAVAVAVPKGNVTFEDLQGKVKAVENRYNPVSDLTMTWGLYGDNEGASLSASRKNGNAYFTGDFDYTDLVVKNGRAYLPLRAVCDMLGEEVGWENATKTPYVMHNGNRVEMKGLLQDGTAFVGVRAFEKLGYTVTYTPSAEGEKTVKLAK